jgi:hypothetical protein
MWTRVSRSLIRGGDYLGTEGIRTPDPGALQRDAKGMVRRDRPTGSWRSLLRSASLAVEVFSSPPTEGP